MSLLYIIALSTGLFVLVWCAFAALTVWVARQRGGSFTQWAVLGLLLGPVGLWWATHHVRPCPACNATVLNEVPVCPVCAADIPRRDPADNPVGPLWSYRKDW